MRPITRVLLSCSILAGICSACAAEKVAIVVHVPADTPAGDSIYLAGSLPSAGNWAADGLKLTPQPDGSFSGHLDLNVGQTLEFKITRGSWDTVEKNADGSERANRMLTAGRGIQPVDITVERWASADSAATTRPSTVVGTLQLHALASKSLNQNRTIRVWLPPGYAADSNARFDVLYMQDGQNCFDQATSAFGHEWQIDETLTRLIKAKRIRPLIVVGIDNGGKDRINEYTFGTDPGYGGGHGPAYAQFVLQDVIPYVEKTYRTQSGQAHRFIGGSSLGGLVALEIARRHPGIFAGVIAMSPSLWWAGQSLTQAVERDAGGLAGTRIWIDSGTREGAAAAPATGPIEAQSQRHLDDIRRFAAALAAHHIDHRLVIDDQHTAHNELAWASRFPQAIVYILNSANPSSRDSTP